MSSSENEAIRVEVESELQELRLLIDQTKLQLQEWSLGVSDADAIEFIEISQKGSRA